MTVTKCDICTKEIKKDQAQLSLMRSGGGLGFVSHTICIKCGAPVVAFVKKHHLDESKPSRSRTARRAA